MDITIQMIKDIIPKLSFKFPYSPEEYLNSLYLENYHCHKDFSNVSTADSAESLENYVKKIKEFGAKCLYSGDHGNQGDQFLTYKLSEENQLKYRHSAEAYWVKNRHDQDKSNCHMMLIAKNQEGRKDINYILSIANEDGYYYKPRIDLELLLSVPKDNIIVTTACIAGWKYPDSEEIWLKIANHFKENFFLEVQYNNTKPQRELNKKILNLARKNNLQIICGLDTHYINDESKIKREQILKYKHTTYPEENGWYMDYPDTKTVIKRFKEQGVLNDIEILTSIMNTNVFVNGCEKIILNKKFKIPSIYKDKTYEEKCKIYKKILNDQYKKEKLKSKEKKNGIKWEVDQVVESGTVDYFLTSRAIVKDAIENEGGILTTTSRGSAASFVTNKLLGLTTVDRFSSEIPIYPERFLTKERVLAGQMPDIDLNVAIQEPFVNATRKLLGEHSCYPLMAIEKLKEKAAWQLYAGANDVAPSDANIISKHLDEYNKKLKYADDEDKKYIHVEDFIPEEYIDLYKKSKDYQGITINLKVHACGHLILDGDIRREIGLISAVSETTKKRTICSAVEGKYLDEFGYVKEDFLIVDSVYLTYKFFKSIGMDVPSFDKLKEMVKNDKDTWNIYSKGITCCINQCEKEATTNKAKKYKPKSIAELSSFIAGIRPGFASLINVFLNRESYTTGEKKIDELLSNSANFMIYQESIMKVLSFLGLEMGETYGVIKSISKKKLKGNKKDDLLNKLKLCWENIFSNTDNFPNVWEVIENSALYAFNSPHAYSMAGDSLYQAWFKAHHTAKFYEVAITHYQEKNKKDKIDALVKEAINFYEYKLGNYEFGNDNRKVNIDDDLKIIYPNLSSIKGFGEKVSNSLYELGKLNYPSFIDLITELKNKSIDSTKILKLIKIDYFRKYGDIQTLLKIYELYDLFYEKKEISKKKVLENGLNIEKICLYGHETPKKINKLESSRLLNDLIKDIPRIELKLEQKIKYQFEVLGIITLHDPSEDKRKYFVTKVEKKSRLSYIELYELYTGKTRKVKIWNSQFDKNEIKEKDIIYMKKIKKQHQREPSGEIDPYTGKKIYVDIPDKFEFWLLDYSILKNEI